VDETNAVASGEPPRSTCAPLTNPLPLKVIAKAPAETDAGARIVRTGTGFCKVTGLLPDADVLAALTAATVTAFELGSELGAEYAPDELIVPVEALPPVTPLTCQVTAEFDDPETVALKDCVAPTRTFAEAGETLTVTLDPDEVLELEDDDPLTVPVHPARAIADSSKTKSCEPRKRKWIGFFMGKAIKKEASEHRIPSP
jgi:hypothetical protein